MTPAADKNGQETFADKFGSAAAACLDLAVETTGPEPSIGTDRAFERGDSLVESTSPNCELWTRHRTVKRSSSLVNAANIGTSDARSAHSENDSELDIYVTDLNSFLSSNGDPAYQEYRRNKLTKWSGRRQNLSKSPDDFAEDHDLLRERQRRQSVFDCEMDAEEQQCGEKECTSNAEGYLTPTMSVYEPQLWTPDVYESVNRSLKEFRKTYQMLSGTCSVDEDEMTGGSSSNSRDSLTGHMKPSGKSNQYLSLPNMDIEDKAMHIDGLIVKSFRHLNNLTKVRFREMLDDDVITTVMERYKDQHRDILFVTPCITKCVMVLQDHVANFLDPIKAKDYDLIFFVLGDSSTVPNDCAHWSLLLLHRPKKTFYHYDSMHGSHYNAAFQLMYKVWSYFKIKKGYQPECEQQPNDTDCGFYVIHNMLRCIRIAKEELYDDGGARITLKEPLKLPLSLDETKSIVIKTYVASIVEKIRKTAVAEKFST